MAWAIAIPVALTAAGFITQYPYGMYFGVVIALAAVAAAAVMAGAVWHRAGAATLASIAALALPFFAGPVLYELYAKQFGTRVDALVVDTGERSNAKGTELSVCRVVDTDGVVGDLSEQQNCHGQFSPGQQVVLFKDPLGGLDPWVEATSDRGLDAVGLGITAGLFAAVCAPLAYAGHRRRTSAEVEARQLRNTAAR